MAALAAAESIPLASADGFAALPGLGARGVVDGREVTVGRSRLFADRRIEVPADLAAWCRAQEQAGCTAVLVSWDDTIRGALAVTDTVKPSAAAAVAGLRGLGYLPSPRRDPRNTQHLRLRQHGRQSHRSVGTRGKLSQDGPVNSERKRRLRAASAVCC